MSFSTPLNVRQEGSGTGELPWIVLNAHGVPTFTANLIVSGTVTASIEATLVNPARATPAGDDIFTLQDWNGITTTTAGTVANQPLAAIRLNQTAGTGSTVFQIQQNGG
ncbi:MAG: hypothetical protein QF535_19070 [Anaerolineales bacterium]|jgi:hypothetical protein|nr:hypothetical protein [Anaerolineales bacterium]